MSCCNLPEDPTNPQAVLSSNFSEQLEEGGEFALSFVNQVLPYISYDKAIYVVGLKDLVGNQEVAFGDNVFSGNWSFYKKNFQSISLEEDDDEGLKSIELLTPGQVNNILKKNDRFLQCYL